MIALPVCYCKTSRYCNWDFVFVYALLPFCSWLLQFKASVSCPVLSVSAAHFVQVVRRHEQRQHLMASGDLHMH